MIIRTRGINPKYKLNDDPYQRFGHNVDNDSVQQPIHETDHDGKLVYNFEFATSFSLDERKEIKIDFWERDLTGQVYETLIKEFAQALALKMQFKDNEITAKYGVPHDFVDLVLNYKK